MELIANILFFTTTSLFIILSYYLIGIALLLMTNSKLCHSVSVCSTIGVGISIVLGYISAKIGIPQSYVINSLIVISLVIILVAKEKLTIDILLAEKKRDILALIISLIILVPPIVKNGLVLYSIGNQDIFYYALHALHLSLYGYADKGDFVNYNLGQWAMLDWTGSKIYLSQCISLMGREATVVVWPSLFAVLYACVGNTIALSSQLARNAIKSSLGLVLLLVLIWCNPIVIHAIGNYFLAQYMEIALLMAAGYFLFLKKDSDRSGENIITAGVLIGSAMITYAHLALIHIFILYIALYFFNRNNYFKNALTISIVALIAANGALLGMLQMGLHVSGAVAGWPLPGFTPLSLFFDQHSLYSEKKVSSAIWSVLIFLIVAILFSVRKKDNFKAVLVMAFIPTAILILFGFSDTKKYIFWKALTSFMPLYFIFFYYVTGVLENKYFNIVNIKSKLFRRDNHTTLPPSRSQSLEVNRPPLDRLRTIFRDKISILHLFSVPLILMALLLGLITAKNTWFSPYYFFEPNDFKEIVRCIKRNNPENIYIDLNGAVNTHLASILLSGIKRSHGNKELNWPIQSATSQVLTNEQSIGKYKNYDLVCQANSLVFLKAANLLGNNIN
jgi:hypothetical protein